MESAAGWAVLSQSYKVLRVDAEAPAGLVRIDGAQPEAAVASLLAQLDAAHISLEGGGDHV